VGKIPNFDSFLGCISTFFAPIKVKFGTGAQSAPPCQISLLSVHSVVRVGRKTYFWTTEYTKYWHAALTDGLSVIRNTVES